MEKSGRTKRWLRLSLLAALPGVEPTIRAIASSRLVIGLTTAQEGIAALSTVGLTTP